MPMKEIERRIVQLETTVLRQRRVGIAGLVALVFMVATAFVAQDAKPSPGPVVDVIRTRRVEVMDKNGRVVILLSTGGGHPGPTSSSSFGLVGVMGEDDESGITMVGLHDGLIRVGRGGKQ